MKEWWLNLSFREKQSASVGGVGIVLLLIYLGIWLPLTNQVTHLRQSIHQNQALLAWMQENDNQLKKIEKNFKKTNHNNVSLLTSLQQELNQTPFSKNLVALKQADNNNVQVQLQNISFDEFIVWLTKLWQEQNITVTQLQINPNITPGMVTTEFTLSTEKV